MSSWTKVWTPSDVHSVDDFIEYCQQFLGCPWPTGKDRMIMKTQCKQLFERYPELDFYSLCRVAAWLKSKKKRPARVWMVVESFREAWQAGALPELNPAERCDRVLESRIAEALKTEDRPEWRRRLLGSRGNGRREVYDSWSLSTSP